ncbi:MULTISPECIES: helix-turn-helix transcriptional regulator [Paraburkholderia]|uniref:AraC-type DNA-binding protein n=1 Tax=Paraburkholderia aspalathi TaxID=1324617 RepID=A0A1I7EIE1_9BURK|nr:MULTISPECIES: helix-turn-helix transcriptional regulator [Paraburkholderia]MCX4153910.1 helix-turn-helix transcriptional regulator [Paraburkholderia aspalathi]MDN7163325.1 helix-turn-helix transcriptional regulator [Paraburkholderia sp. SECH2]MDQ6391810.1 helix-turn-helix transcriptional regulator [Paraburkholderia aspalathi]SFU23667.1 AraC-type DNA-binding protein [Paraburkholderia aspalathi]
MFSMLYFPVVSALATPAPCAHTALSGRFLDTLLDGKLNAASQLASRWADEAGNAEFAPHALQLHADLQLMLGIEVEAEENYRRSQKLIRSSKHAIRTASCRNAAWQAFFRHRLGTALACFSRVADEPEIEPARAVEAHFGIVCVLYELGRTSEAADALDDLFERVERDLDDAAGHWHALLATLRFDLAVQMEVRNATALRDHVYWQSGLSSERVPRPGQGADASVDSLARAVFGVRSPLLRARIDYLQQLRLAACADRDAIGELQRHLQWSREQGIGDYQRTLRLEIALATLAGAAPHLACSILEPLHQIGRNGTTGHRQLEYLYCSAKTRQAEGRAQESLQLYSRYALVAMQCLREDSQVRAPFLQRSAKASPQLDDVGARLPAKYRRAYSYVLDNLDRRDLSVREVAAEIGVTERALQSAFKNFLGLSPTELIRRQRMERIRAELTDRSYSSDRGVLGAASKWGVQNRSTLVNGYRKQFHEAPSETLER